MGKIKCAVPSCACSALPRVEPQGFRFPATHFHFSQVGKVRSEDSGRHQPRSTSGAAAPPQRFPPPPDRDLSQRNFPLSDRVGPCRLAPEAPSKFCLYPCTGPDPSPADVDPKSGITNPLPNLNLTTSFRPSKTTVAKRNFVDGPLRRRHRPLDLISLHTPTLTSESPASDTPHAPEPDHRRPTFPGRLWWLGPSHTATFACNFSPYPAHLWR